MWMGQYLEQHVVCGVDMIYCLLGVERLLAKSMKWRFKSSNRQGNKLSSERDDRYVKEKVKKRVKV
jgi:hypothetical protein